MQTITSNAANFLERSNALRYLEGDPICNPSRAKAYIAKYGKPVEEKLTWFSVKSIPYNIVCPPQTIIGPEKRKQKFFLEERHAREYAESIKEPQIIKFLGSTRDFIYI
jgi:hypothetical protein